MDVALYPDHHKGRNEPAGIGRFPIVLWGGNVQSQMTRC